MMNKYEKGLAALDRLFENTTAEEFERDYLAVEKGLGTKVEDYLMNENKVTIRRTCSTIGFETLFEKPINKTFKIYYTEHLDVTPYSCSNDEMESQGLAA
jgi:hypothetical protein